MKPKFAHVTLDQLMAELDPHRFDHMSPDELHQHRTNLNLISSSIQSLFKELDIIRESKNG